MEKRGGVQKLHRQGQLHLEGSPPNGPRGQKDQAGADALAPRRHQVLMNQAHEEDVGGYQLGKGLLKAVKGSLEVGKNHHAPQYSLSNLGKGKSVKLYRHRQGNFLSLAIGSNRAVFNRLHR